MLDNQNTMHESPIDFTKIEKIDFYGCDETFEPDCVYLNKNGHLVAFISSEKCHELKRNLKKSAENYYNDNNALLFIFGPEIQNINDSHDCELSFFQKGHNYLRCSFRSVYSGFGLYFLVTSLIMIFCEESDRIY